MYLCFTVKKMQFTIYSTVDEQQGIHAIMIKFKIISWVNIASNIHLESDGQTFFG